MHQKIVDRVIEKADVLLWQRHLAAAAMNGPFFSFYQTAFAEKHLQRNKRLQITL